MGYRRCRCTPAWRGKETGRSRRSPACPTRRSCPPLRPWGRRTRVPPGNRGCWRMRRLPRRASRKPRRVVPPGTGSSHRCRSIGHHCCKPHLARASLGFGRRSARCTRRRPSSCSNLWPACKPPNSRRSPPIRRGKATAGNRSSSAERRSKLWRSRHDDAPERVVVAKAESVAKAIATLAFFWCGLPTGKQDTSVGV